MVVGRAEEKILDYQTVHRHARGRVQGNPRVARRLAGIGECREVGAYFVPNARPAADALQRPLRSRFRARLRRGVDMTSNVKSWRKNSHDVFCMLRSSC
jgi:hypothetical protein